MKGFKSQGGSMGNSWRMLGKGQGTFWMDREDKIPPRGKERGDTNSQEMTE